MESDVAGVMDVIVRAGCMEFGVRLLGVRRFVGWPIWRRIRWGFAHRGGWWWEGWGWS